MADQHLDTWLTVLDHWQTLFTGTLAIFAAFIGGGFVYYQTRTAQLADRDRLSRRHAAARSTLPLVLSGLMDYARHVSTELRRLYLSSPDNAVSRESITAFDLPRLPTELIRSLAEVIEAASNEVAVVISDLLSQLQVQHGRLRGMKDDAASGLPGRRNLLKIELDSYISDIADIYARCEGLLGYARRESESADLAPDGESLRRALTLMGFHEPAFDRVKEAVQRRAQRETQW